MWIFALNHTNWPIFNTLLFSFYPKPMITVDTKHTLFKVPHSKHHLTTWGWQWVCGNESASCVRDSSSSWGIYVTMQASVACDVLTVALYTWSDDRITPWYRYANEWQYRQCSMLLSECSAQARGPPGSLNKSAQDVNHAALPHDQKEEEREEYERWMERCGRKKSREIMTGRRTCSRLQMFIPSVASSWSEPDGTVTKWRRSQCRIRNVIQNNPSLHLNVYIYMVTPFNIIPVCLRHLKQSTGFSITPVGIWALHLNTV